MGTETLELQVWLNNKGAQLAVDGKAGPATRRATIEAFRNLKAAAITPGELKMIADRLGASVAQVAAVAAVESNGGGWDDAGLLKCLWERHYLFKRLRFSIPLISDPKPGGYTIDADHDGINDSWEKLADAAARYGRLAFECASFGKFQIMGAHWKTLGYASVLDFVWQLSQSELAHYDAFARYLEANSLVAALRQVDGNAINCRALARGYNGSGYATYSYDVKIAHAFRVWR
jgi:hypothetical protein